MPKKRPTAQEQPEAGDDIVTIAGVSGSRRELEKLITSLKELPPVPPVEKYQGRAAELQRQNKAWLEAWRLKTGMSDEEWAQRMGAHNGHLPAPQKAKKRAKRRDSSTKDLLTIQGAADRAGVHYQTIRNWIKSGQLECFQRGATVRIPAEALLASIQRERGKANT